MKTYKIIFDKYAERFLAKQSKDIAKRILSKIDLLAIDPFPNGIKKIVGGAGELRIRIGDYMAMFL